MFDNLLPTAWQNDIENCILDGGFPWYFTVDVTHGYETPVGQRAPAFYHILRKNYENFSQHYKQFQPIAYLAAEKVGLSFKDIYEARLFLQLPLSTDFLSERTGLLHVDPAPYNNIVVLYYVLDSDGDTIIVDRKRSTPDEKLKNLSANNENIIAEITPKKGRCIVFDGDYYHTAVQPNTSLRAVINFNLVR